jgi:hypothetical protein
MPGTGHNETVEHFPHSGHSITSSLIKFCVLVGGSRDPAARSSANPPTVDPAHRRAARYALALLLARIHEVFPLVKA